MALLGANASEPSVLALTHSTILARLPLAPAEDFSAEGAWRGEKTGVTAPETHPQSTAHEKTEKKHERVGHRSLRQQQTADKHLR